MDIGTIQAAIATVRGLFGLAKELKEQFPSGEGREVYEKALEKSEQQIKIAEAEIAKGLGYEICHCKFPPPIMLSTRRDARLEIFECPECEGRAQRTFYSK